MMKILLAIISLLFSQIAVSDMSSDISRDTVDVIVDCNSEIDELRIVKTRSYIKWLSSIEFSKNYKAIGVWELKKRNQEGYWVSNPRQIPCDLSSGVHIVELSSLYIDKHEAIVKVI